MFFAISLAILIMMSLALARAFIGPSLYDRILALNTFGTKTVLLVAVIGVVSGQASFLDVALVYALINFVGVLAVLRFFEFSTEADKKEGAK